MNLIRSCAFIVLLCLLAATGCKNKPDYKPVIGDKPVWIFQGGGRMEDERGPVVQGVGKVENIRALQLARSKADSEARAAVAKFFSDWIEGLMAKMRDKGVQMNEENWAKAGKALTMVDAKGSEITDRYVDAETGTWFSQATATYKRFNDLIQKSPDMPDAVKTFVNDNGAAAFGSLPEVQQVQ